MPALLYGGILACALGVAVRTVLPVPLAFVGLLGIIALGLLALFIRYRVALRGIGVVVVLLFFTLGIARTTWLLSDVGTSPLAPSVDSEVTLVGVVAREPDMRERSVHLYVRTDDGDLVLVTADRYETAVSYGDRVVVSGTLKEPESFTTDLGRTFDYPGYLLARGVEYRLSYPDVTVQEGDEGNVLLSFLYTVKGRFVEALGSVLPEPAFGLGVGLLLGVKQALGEELARAFQVTGLTHLVVLSGYNLSLVVAFVGVVLSFFLRPRARLAVGLLCIAGFAFMVGLSATVLRASLMAALALVATTFGRQYLVLRALLVSAFLMLLWNPLLLVYDIGFQFSFMATLGLILVAPELEIKMVQGKILMKLREFFVATVAAQVAVLPLLLYHIGEASLVSVIVNVLVLPVVPVAMAFTFLTGLLALFVSPLAVVVAYPTTLVLTYITGMASAWATVPFAAIPVPSFSFWWVCIMYLCLALGWWWVRERRARQDKQDSTSELGDWTVEDEEVVRRTLLETLSGASPVGDSPLNASSPPTSTPEPLSQPPILFR